MSHDLDARAAAGGDLAGSLADLSEVGIRAVRLQYADLHGVCRGKDIPSSAFAHAAEEGIGFVAATMTVDLAHNVIAGFEEGFPDLLARPDLNTLVRLPWQPGVAACIVDLEDPVTHEPWPVDSRGALKRTLAEFAGLGVSPVIAPELEFYLCEADASAPNGYRAYARQESPVYTVGEVADPKGTLSRMLDAAVELGLGAIAAAHEYGRSQFEINLRHTLALDSADRAFRYKALVKELAARDGLLATFIGKPFNDDEGSGLHLHISLVDGDGANACEDPAGAQGLTAITRHFIAGVLDHAPAMMGFFNPTVNAYRRISAEALVPTRCCWGHDHRMTLVRVPKDRGPGTRVEIRLGDGTANPYLAYTAALAAGLDGIRRELEPPEPLEGMIYELPEEMLGEALPVSFERALAALEDDPVIAEGVGEKLVETFKTIKAAELERFNAWVTDWEFAEYAPRL
ncbi:MAG: glutamine synthetase [Solirubrobacterales bacterium]|nr:glutamine synthetase [Solirubrobacterales bacterium]MBV9799039.1 glutamine synthetase [Solirubrobacterales bacterium]